MDAGQQPSNTDEFLAKLINGGGLDLDDFVVPDDNGSQACHFSSQALIISSQCCNLVPQGQRLVPVCQWKSYVVEPAEGIDNGHTG